ncbi:hypothetical protein EDD16DRAFT_1516738 [Pisolithus croceorrhizus]|nr:hypothetical protein EDD16DRAFT_1516738 [Pisolithus croceorrhizus]
MVVRRVLNPTHPHSHYENEHRIGDLVQTRSPMFEPRQAMLVFSRQVALNGGRKLGAQQRLKKWGVLVRRKRHRILKEPLAAPGDSQQKGVHRYARYRISQSKSSNLYRNTAATCGTPTAGQYLDHKSGSITTSMNPSQMERLPVRESGSVQLRLEHRNLGVKIAAAELCNAPPPPGGPFRRLGIDDRELQKSLRQDLGHGIDTVDRDSNITLAVGYPEGVFNIWERKGSKVKSHPISCDRWIIGWSTPTYAQPPPRADTRRACNPLLQSWAVKLRRVDVNKMTRTNENGLALIEIQT